MQEVLPEWRTAVLLRVVVAKFPLMEVIHYFFSSIFHGHLRESQMFGYRITYWRWRCYLADPNVTSGWEFHFIRIPDRLWAVWGRGGGGGGVFPGWPVLLRWTPDALLSTNSYDAV